MSIWKTTVTLDVLTDRNQDTMADFLGIQYTEIGDDYLVATMPVNERTRQPIGIMHGAASCVLAETLGSNAANMAVDYETQYCVGLDINTNHIRSIRKGVVTAVAKPFHLGRSTQVWEIKITDEQQRLISVNRLTMAVLCRKK